MTPTDPHERDPRLTDAESEAVGARIRELAQTVDAPPALRARLAAGAAPRRRVPRLRVVLPAAATAAAAVVAALLVFAGGAASPSVGDAVALALSRPTDAAPAVRAATTLDARVGGVTFPNYAYRWPAWRAAGARRDTISGRAATTVTYRGPQGDVGYTIVAGKPIGWPRDARLVRRSGIDLWVSRQGGATVVTWERDGHTCVLAGRGADVERQLVAFATWA